LRSRRRSALFLFGFLAALVLAYGYGLAVNPLLPRIKKGLDLVGGSHIVLRAVPTPDAPVTPDAMRTAQEVIRRRVDSLGVTEPVIQLWGSDRIVVDLPQASPEEARRVIGRTALLEFREGPAPEGRVIVTGANLRRARAEFGPGGQPIVSLEFDAEGAAKIREATARLVGRPLYMYLDRELIMDPPPRVQEEIPSGRAQITGLSSIEEAHTIAVLLSSGALPVRLEIIEDRSVSALLGAESVARSQRAALYGVLAVVLYMLALYGLPGLFANISLALYMLLLMGTLLAIDATLTLPGIAGIILSVGMAVDANVIIFERIREELAAGKSLKAAVEAGFRNAWSAILDSNLTTLIAAAALIWWGTGPVKGFGVTLFAGVVASMVSNVFVSRLLIVHFLNLGWVRSGTRLFRVRGAEA
jgi:preprotein translocase subunit SecD